MIYVLIGALALVIFGAVAVVAALKMRETLAKQLGEAEIARDIAQKGEQVVEKQAEALLHDRDKADVIKDLRDPSVDF